MIFFKLFGCIFSAAPGSTSLSCGTSAERGIPSAPTKRNERKGKDYRSEVQGNEVPVPRSGIGNAISARHQGARQGDAAAGQPPDHLL